MNRIRRNQSERDNKKRKGLMTLEVVLVLPLLLLLLFGIFEFSLLFTARGQVVDAARAGARLGTLHGVSEADVELEVRRSLNAAYAPIAQIDSKLGEYPGDEIIVTVKVPMVAATPDLLWPIGYSVKNRKIIAQTRMVKE